MTIIWNGPIWYEINGRGPTVYPTESGVYLILEKDEYDREIVRYVGQADDIRRRMSDHEKNIEDNEELKKLMQTRIDDVRVRHTTVHDITRRNNLEHTAFVDFGGLEKLYNKKIPEGIYLQGINYPIS